MKKSSLVLLSSVGLLLTCSNAIASEEETVEIVPQEYGYTGNLVNSAHFFNANLKRKRMKPDQLLKQLLEEKTQVWEKDKQASKWKVTSKKETSDNNPAFNISLVEVGKKLLDNASESEKMKEQENEKARRAERDKRSALKTLKHNKMLDALLAHHTVFFSQEEREKVAAKKKAAAEAKAASWVPSLPWS